MSRAAERPTFDRLTAPEEHLGVLAEPPAGRLREPNAADDAALDAAPILDVTVGMLRRSLWEGLGLTGPVIATGHQVEFFHAGVLAKLIAVDALVRRAGGQGVFVAVDSDLPKTTRLVVPQVTSGGLRRVEVDIPACEPTRLLEMQPRAPRAHWQQFFGRIETLHQLYGQSLLPRFAAAWLAGGADDLEICEAHARGVEATKAALGLEHLRTLRMSTICGRAEFRALAGHLLLHAEHVAAAYNAAQAAYRDRHGIRAAGRPVPLLAVEAGRLELPLWVVRAGEPRRRLYVAQRSDGGLDVFADGVLIGRVRRAELDTFAASETPWELERAGWRLRPRALLLSGLLRLMLADVFIHGIGGAKYDEMTEEFIEGSLHVAPRPMGCVTATLHLPLPREGARAADLAAARHASRDVRFNPQRHVRELPVELVGQRAELVRRSDELRAHEPRDHVNRRLVFREIRRVSEQMLTRDPWRAAEYDRRAAALEEQLRLDRIATDREYFYALHPLRSLEALADAVRGVVRG